jgi:putative ABC transport system permease protein
MTSRVKSAFRALLRGPAIESQLDEEMRFHIDMETRKLVERGLPPEEARREALLAFGGIEKHKEESRDATGAPVIETLLQDVRYGVRGLKRNPVFAAAAVATLALGIGANAAIFSVVHGVFLQALPYGGGDGLVRLRQDAPAINVTDAPFSPVELTDYAARNRTLAGLAEYHSMWFVLLGKSEPERVQTGVVAANYFDVLGVKPLLGRSFRAGEDEAGAEPLLLLSYDYWMRSWGGDPGVVGRALRMNDRIHTVIGVLPPMPAYPDDNDVYMPVSACPFRGRPEMNHDRTQRMVQVFARIKPGVSLAAARADLNGIGQGLATQYPEAYPAKGSGFVMGAVSLRDELTQSARPTFLVLFGIVGLVLLLACANVANLTLARLLRRRRELALRSALGAGRLRLARQLVTESTLVALAGGALGLLFASGGLRLLVAFAARFTPRAREIAIDGPVLLFALVVSLVTGIAFGLIPAVSARRSLTLALQEGGDRSTSGVVRHRMRSALIVLQVAISFTLLIGAGLMIRSLWKLQGVDPGFRVGRVLTTRLDLNFTKYTDAPRRWAFEKQVLERLAQQPGVVTAAISGSFPLNETGPNSGRFEIEGRRAASDDLRPQAEFQRVSSDYFSTIGVPLLSGRVFAASDSPETPRVAVISRSLARRFWETKDPVGERISFDRGKSWIAIVGVAGDVRQYGLAAAPPDEIYLALPQFPTLSGSLLVRTTGSPLALSRLVRETVHSIDPDQPVDRFRTLEEARSNSLASPRLTATLLSLFAALALAVTSAGIAGVMAFTVGERTHEFGIRMALGAEPGSVLTLVLRQAMTLVAAGLALGFVGAHLLARLMSGLLFEINATDPPTFLAMSVVLVVVALTASFFPARRATSVDPMIALRSA